MTSKVLTPTTSYMFYWMVREGTCGKNIYVCVRVAAWFRTIAILFFSHKESYIKRMIYIYICMIWYVIIIYIYTIYIWNIHRKHRKCSIYTLYCNFGAKVSNIFGSSHPSSLASRPDSFEQWPMAVVDTKMGVSATNSWMRNLKTPLAQFGSRGLDRFVTQREHFRDVW